VIISSDRDVLASRFAQLRQSRRSALIPYLTAGYPTPDAMAGLLDAYTAAGADVIEVGVPFSDPVADGPTIQRSSLHALKAGVTLGWTLEQIAAFHPRGHSSIVVFSYLNPILAYGPERFLRDAVDAGAAGVLLTDLPVGGDPELEALFEASPLALIRLIAPTTPRERVADIAARAQGFLYYIARLGVTGAGSDLREELAGEIAVLRQLTDRPIAVGFGIATPAHARAVAQVADGVIVGSALIDALDRGGIEEAARLLAAMRAAMDASGDPRLTG
jgi:tryptophan synthase alpha chain